MGDGSGAGASLSLIRPRGGDQESEKGVQIREVMATAGRIDLLECGAPNDSL
jgi:hypothetical protein